MEPGLGEQIPGCACQLSFLRTPLATEKLRFCPKLDAYCGLYDGSFFDFVLWKFPWAKLNHFLWDRSVLIPLGRPERLQSVFRICKRAVSPRITPSAPPPPGWTHFRHGRVHIRSRSSHRRRRRRLHCTSDLNATERVLSTYFLFRSRRRQVMKSKRRRRWWPLVGKRSKNLLSRRNWNDLGGGVGRSSFHRSAVSWERTEAFLEPLGHVFHEQREYFRAKMQRKP